MVWLCPPRGGIPHPGTTVAYKQALRFTPRIYVSAACKAGHPDGMLALHRTVELGRCTIAGSRRRLERKWRTFLEQASHRSTARGCKAYVALVTPKEMHQEPYCALPRVCRQTFGAFARDIVHIIPSRGPRLAGKGSWLLGV